MSDENTTHSLDRFLDAQNDVYETALHELRTGHKQTHWMWFIFPQIQGLGHSSTARHYAIKNPAEARAYLAHPVLGERLRECTRAVLAHKGLSTRAIFGYPDNLKFCSSMTLFDYAGPGNELFDRAIDRCCGGERDKKTLELLKEPV